MVQKHAVRCGQTAQSFRSLKYFRWTSRVVVFKMRHLPWGRKVASKYEAYLTGIPHRADFGACALSP